jgi:hypothetical protein
MAWMERPESPFFGQFLLLVVEGERTARVHALADLFRSKVIKLVQRRLAHEPLRLGTEMPPMFLTLSCSSSWSMAVRSEEMLLPALHELLRGLLDRVEIQNLSNGDEPATTASRAQRAMTTQPSKVRSLEMS